MTDEDYNWELTFGDYQEKARETAIYPNNAAIVYPILGLCGEAGELANKVKKMIRDGIELDEIREFVIKELGDCLWYAANIATDVGVDFAYVANVNLDKLADRKERGVLGGSGDER